MNQQEYLIKLESLLSSLPTEERSDIMYDYNEHFRDGLADGKTETEIITALGSPERIASLYVILSDMDGSKAKGETKKDVGSELQIAQGKPNPYYDRAQSSDSASGNTSSTIHYNQNVGRSGGSSAVVAILLVFFNLIFVLGPYLGLWGVVIGFIGASIGLVVAGVALFIASIVQSAAFMTIPANWLAHPIVIICASVIVLSLGFLFSIGTFYMTKGLVWISGKYIKFNVKLIKGW